ncbi:MAG TPA: hypothetical protein PKE49_15005, partial [Leptospiraceae bacterium]|nr:hypothetical protein [Leptospiraceae bacterium]
IAKAKKECELRSYRFSRSQIERLAGAFKPFNGKNAKPLVGPQLAPVRRFSIRIDPYRAATPASAV